MAVKEMKFYIAEIQGNVSGIFYTWCRLILVNQNQQRQKKSSNNLNHICVKSSFTIFCKKYQKSIFSSGFPLVIVPLTSALFC